jgi:hypothetical protein
MGILPTEAYSKGQTIPSRSPSPVVAKSGIWKLAIRRDDFEVGHALRDLLSGIGSEQEPFRAIPNLEDAYVDIFLAHEGEGDVQVLLDRDVLESLSTLGLPVQLTVAHTRGE